MCRKSVFGDPNECRERSTQPRASRQTCRLRALFPSNNFIFKQRDASLFFSVAGSMRHYSGQTSGPIHQQVRHWFSPANWHTLLNLRPFLRVRLPIHWAGFIKNKTITRVSPVQPGRLVYCALQRRAAGSSHVSARACDVWAQLESRTSLDQQRGHFSE
jgi:hypothetical protein